MNYVQLASIPERRCLPGVITIIRIMHRHLHAARLSAVVDFVAGACCCSVHFRV
jgi:hypothetical protein